jgi:predicted CoA-binding protein
MNQDKIVILGASENSDRASYAATKLLNNRGYDIYALNDHKGKIGKYRNT